MAFGVSKGWLEAQDEAQADIVKDMEGLRRYATSPADHEAIDLVIDEAKSIRRRIAARRVRSAMFKA